MAVISDNLRGAALMAVAMAAFTLNDTCIKLLSGEVPLMQVVFLRSVVITVLIGAVVLWRGLHRTPVSRRDRRLIALRAVAEVLAAYFFLTALFNMPLADLTAILQALPLAVTLGAAVFLSEPVGWRRWAAIAVGFAGVLLIVRPGSDIFTIYSVYGVATVACAAARDLVTRRLSREVPTLLVTLVTGIAVGLMGLGLAPLLGEQWVVPDGRAVRLIGGASILVIVAYLTIIMAMRVGEISFVAPFRYTGLVVAIVVGIAVFGQWPDEWTLLGAAIVVGSGLFSFWRERQRAVPRVPIPPR